MWKSVVVFAALFACILADATVWISWGCMNHVNVTSNLDANKYFEEYRMVAGGKTVYTLEYVNKDGQFYYGLGVFDPFGDCSSADVYTNQTGECAFVPAVELYETYVSEFVYTGEPTEVECPDGEDGCIKYCSQVKCIVLNDWDELVQDINLATDEILTYTYIDDYPSADIYNLECAGTTFTPVNYCDIKWTSINWDCAYHINVTSNSTPSKYYDEYRMMYGSHAIYSLEYVHTDDEDYYGLAIFDVLSYPVTLEVLSNMTGTCAVYNNISVYETYEKSFTYYGNAETVNCPDGTTGCKQYCSVIKCIILDANGRLMEDINLETKEALLYKYLDDPPTPDMFSMECAGKTYTALDFCTKKAVNIDWKCAFHVNVSSNASSEYFDEYRMTTEGKTAYCLKYITTADEFYYELESHDLSDVSMYTVYTNRSECEEYFAIGNDEIYDSEFVYYYDPETVNCPDGSTGCKQYCSLIRCIIVDSNNRLLQQIDTDSKAALLYTYLDDVPSVDTFSLACPKELGFNFTNYCAPKQSSSTVTPSSAHSSTSSAHSSTAGSNSQVSAGSIAEAALTVVIAALLVVLF